MDLQKIIINFCIDHIKWLIALEIVTFIFVIIGRDKEWEGIRKVIEIFFAILSIVLVILLIIYLAPFVKNSLF